MKRLCEAAFDEVRRIIREEEPPVPSKKPSTLGAGLDDVSQHRLKYSDRIEDGKPMPDLKVTWERQ